MLPHSHALQILLRDFFPYTEIARHIEGLGSTCDRWIAIGSSGEGHRSEGSRTIWHGNLKSFGNRRKSHSWHWASSPIKAPASWGKRECERGRKAQTFLYVMATFHKAFCYHGNEHGINTLADLPCGSAFCCSYAAGLVYVQAFWWPSSNPLQ